MSRPTATFSNNSHVARIVLLFYKCDGTSMVFHHLISPLRTFLIFICSTYGQDLSFFLFFPFLHFAFFIIYFHLFHSHFLSLLFLFLLPFSFILSLPASSLSLPFLSLCPPLNLSFYLSHS